SDMGHAWAQFNLASLILHTGDGDGSRDEALSLFVRAARGGNAKAMTIIGQACEEGWRAAPKPAAARRWYLRAARRGCVRSSVNGARLWMEEGDDDGAVVGLRRAIGAGPKRLWEELGDYLATHPEARLREVSAQAWAQARAARAGPPPQG